MNLLVLLAVIGTGIAGGVFFAFSSFVMPALRRLPAAHGIAAMQSINSAAVTPVFMADFVGTALVCLAVLITGWDDPYLITGSLLYLAGVFLLTLAYHLPRNTALAALAPDAPGAADHWDRYLRQWNRGNHLRALAGIAASAVLIGGLDV
ncbi:MAG: anthrone oxygenase family protein [Streptosporangiaceae bacterium]